ncbi:replication factor C subunit 1 isoform X1 [Clupea harengus]|uniref:Replication factor C subunit 1 n=1 Tax=Clupea harengus TaxID=7950 RepID=A0A6P8EV43_CLUHA|nr:replication factor C subunit 1 isoform X1 [Clupea harengus]
MDIRRFFAPSKPAPPKAPSDSGIRTDEEQKLIKKKSVSKSSEEKLSGKRKKRAVIDSDSEEEEKKQRKPKKERQKEKADPPVKTEKEKKGPIQYVSDSDSDDAFLSLKKPVENGLKKAGKGAEKKTQKGLTKDSVKSPPKSLVKSPTIPKPKLTSPVRPKLLSPPKQTHTSVLDYFGSCSVQRSDKKLVASVKRKAQTQDLDESQNDEVIATQLQMDEDMELEKQIHEDEEFARTLAMLDEAPLAKKARKDSGEGPSSSSSISKLANRTDHVSHNQKLPSPTKAPKDSGDRPGPIPSPTKQTIKMESQNQRQPTPKTTPKKASSKLASLKRRDEEQECIKKEEKEEKEEKKVFSPKKEPTHSERAFTPKTGGASTRTGSAITPKTGSAGTPGSSKVSPKKPDTSPEDSEKRRGNSAAFRNFLNRDGPRALGSKEIPVGAENCLEGLTFVVTGVLESIERDEAKTLIERYGGKVTGNISRKTSYLVLGRDGGVSKTEKAESLGTQILDEDGLLELIRNKPGKKSKYEIAAETENKSVKSKTKASPRTQTPRASPRTQTPRTSPRTKTPRTPQHTPSPRKARQLGAKGQKTPEKSVVKKVLTFGQSSATEDSGSSLMWVDKYRPQSLKAVIGQQGEQSCASKLRRWLQSWYSNHSGDKPAAARFGRFGGKDDGATLKAALLSGPPGVGKTTTAALVCQELGYSYVEMNASCARSKNTLKEVIAESLNNTSIKNFYSGTSQTVSRKHVLIMDEVDGMAGNEDRGGIQEMISLIKTSKIPIICMCNDRNHQKIRSLANYCFDLRFQRPRLEQIKGAMMSICFKEGVKIPPPALNEIILASNQDVRQVLHNLSMWSAKDKVMTYDQVKADANNARKDMKMGPFDVCRKVFASGDEAKQMSLMDKSDLFFHDYSLAPLFVQENYVHVRPAAAGGNLKSHMVLLSKTADSICDGDLVDRQIRSKQTWSLLPTQAVYASVLPGALMSGYMSQFPTFPSWLGKFSSTGKHSRIIQELASHMCLRTLSSKQAVNLDYLPYMRSALLEPLQRAGAEGASQSVQLMDDYNLIKEDVDCIMEISTWGGRPDPYSKLDPKVKAAFTRAYNKESHLTPYSLQAVKKGRRGGPEADLATQDGDNDNDSQQQEEEEEEQGVDAMIKQKKAKPVKVKAEDSGKGKGKGKGRGKGKK